VNAASDVLVAALLGEAGGSERGGERADQPALDRDEQYSDKMRWQVDAALHDIGRGGTDSRDRAVRQSQDPESA